MLAKAGAAVVGVAGGGLVLRYRRDLVAAHERLAQWDRRTARTVGGAVEYCEWGDGPPVLLVHGVVGGCDVPPSWRALVPSGYRIIAPSRFGYLGAAMPSKPSVADQADVFAMLLDALEIEHTVVLGFSAGSTSSIQFALRHADRVRGLILVAANAPHAQPVQLVPRPLARLVFSQPTLWCLRVFVPKRLAQIAGAPADYPLSERDRRTLETIFDSFFPMRLRAEGTIFDGYVGNSEVADYPFEQITVPTLGVHAADDPLASYNDARAMVARIPGSHWVQADRGGHIFIHNDRRALREIAAFLADNTQSGTNGTRKRPTSGSPSETGAPCGGRAEVGTVSSAW